ncbi:MAG: Na+/H+ antiporter NhaA [Bacteroidales bacterium]|jgi:NhaA family Na+:H+ antiporter
MTTPFSKPKVNRRIEIRNIFSLFFKNQSNGGIVLLCCAILAIIIANTPQLNFLNGLWEQKFGLFVGSAKIEMTLRHWINDGLMAIFFFVVGLEIKREMFVGELSSIKQAALPIFAAFGGMVVPALIYLFFNYRTESQNGWGIPMATDIAFALGILSLLGKRVPVSLKVFLTALAIVDDLGAIVVLALFYPTHAIQPELLIYSGGIIILLVLFNRLNIHKAIFYIIPGILLWIFILGSGIHATIAGVLLAMTIPGKTSLNEVRFYIRCKYLLEKFKTSGNHEVMVLANPLQIQIIQSMHNSLRNINPLMQRFEHSLSPVVTYIIMPVFALANAGVLFDNSLFSAPIAPVAKGIFLGLLVGKPFGIFFASWIACKLRMAQLPAGVKWNQIFSLGIIAGIGFTMSIFIDNLAFTDSRIIDTGKVTILITSLVAALVGLIATYYTTKSNIDNKTN